ncbi:MAG TPA: hypothetical protein PKA33_03885 [Amaricoccus sp.]|uniref:hypothetical protein n=1 Tax=Amaricoccus sp. TaxID=1872485 RepID=UPI002D177B64|nr:hypothetical protein [Amaricoccus sp.]HMQ92149.1 hypothetical protein [Amaricoccus sp.]HMR51518.1 hypothetical protein [Amaricoccus sp.]HMR59631.1 hypothetical protein [Amaricoccus sp.]HMT98494.1 hypothetical protein [Amaricoccus sp.]
MADDFIIPDSPLSHGIEAARKGNLGGLRVGAASLVAEKGQLPEGFDDKDLIAILEFLKAICVDTRSDTAGTELERVSAFHRSGTTEWRIDLDPG